MIGRSESGPSSVDSSSSPTVSTSRASLVTSALGPLSPSNLLFRRGHSLSQLSISSDVKKGREHPATPAALFPDAHAMKASLRRQIMKPQYDVADFYHTVGFSQWLARRHSFELITLFAIGLNAIWIWIDTDYNPGDMLLNSPPAFQIVENCFCIYFAFEWSIRFSAFRRKRHTVRDAWFIFDSLLVAVMVFETWIMTAIILMISNGNSGSLGDAAILRIARLLRLTRMARMARLLRAMPELVILIKGMVAAMRSVCFTMALLGSLLYVFGIAFVQLCGGNDCQQLFPDVLTGMYTLLVHVCLQDNLNKVINDLDGHIHLMILFFVFILIGTLTVLNMLIGVICEVVSAVAAIEREALSLNFVREKINELMNDGSAGENMDGLISKAEFLRLLENEKAVTILQDVGVDVIGLVDVVDIIFAGDLKHHDGKHWDVGEKQLTFADFMGLVLDLRGGNTATVRDTVNLRKYIEGRFHRLETLLESGCVGDGSASEGTSVATSRLLRLSPHETPKSTKCFPREAPGEPPVGCKLHTARHTPAFQDVFKTMNDLLTAHEGEVARLEEENRAFKQKHASSSGSAANSLSAASQFTAYQDLKRTDESPSRCSPEEAELQSCCRIHTWTTGLRSGDPDSAVHSLPRPTLPTTEDILDSVVCATVRPVESEAESHRQLQNPNLAI